MNFAEDCFLLAHDIVGHELGDARMEQLCAFDWTVLPI
jgi:hypothetical protein